MLFNSSVSLLIFYKVALSVIESWLLKSLTISVQLPIYSSLLLPPSFLLRKIFSKYCFNSFVDLLNFFKKSDPLNGFSRSYKMYLNLSQSPID